MASGVESLNAAAAATVLFYEAARQRNSATPAHIQSSERSEASPNAEPSKNK
jgi:tRNA C32,U32 (ribose-2'-O)-methylase TrmJ